MTSIEELKSQFDNGSFKNMIYTIFNYIDDNGTLIEMKNRCGKMLDIDDLEFMKFALNEDERTLIKMMDNVFTMKNFSELKKYVDTNVEGNKTNVLIPIKSNGMLVAIRNK